MTNWIFPEWISTVHRCIDAPYIYIGYRVVVVVVVLHNIRNKGCKQNEWCLAAHRACRVALLLTGKPSTIERLFLPCLSWMELKTSIRDSRRRKTLISQKRNVQGKKTPRVSSHAASSSLYVCPLISVCWAITI